MKLVNKLVFLKISKLSVATEACNDVRLILHVQVYVISNCSKQGCGARLFELVKKLHLTILT
jgi:hypothetical protein